MNLLINSKTLPDSQLLSAQLSIKRHQRSLNHLSASMQIILLAYFEQVPRFIAPQIATAIGSDLQRSPPLISFGMRDP